MFGFADWWKRAQESAMKKKVEDATLQTASNTKKIEQHMSRLVLTGTSSSVWAA
jgi:hypothetical protein